jgi:hypothetical protein
VRSADEELTISYTGPAGYTSQRLMAQYGFVIPEGNPSDRLSFMAAPQDDAGWVAQDPGLGFRVLGF